MLGTHVGEGRGREETTVDSDVRENYAHLILPLWRKHPRRDTHGDHDHQPDDDAPAESQCVLASHVLQSCANQRGLAEHRRRRDRIVPVSHCDCSFESRFESSRDVDNRLVRVGVCWWNGCC
jgi:hypothetical protein